MHDDMTRARALVERLRAEPGLLPFPAAQPQLIETHGSWVLLCGEDALKIKKPVHLGFIDFSTKVRRDRFAREEIRLNRRMAPELYLGVLPITGTPQAPRFDGRGPLLETAVHMRQFDPADQLDALLDRDGLGPGDLDETAAMIANFQAQAPRTEPADPWGRTATVMEPIRENFRRIREAAADLADLEPRLAALEAASEARGRALELRFAERRAGGFIREGHGDLHLGNLARTRWASGPSIASSSLPSCAGSMWSATWRSCSRTCWTAVGRTSAGAWSTPGPTGPGIMPACSCFRCTRSTGSWSGSRSPRCAGPSRPMPRIERSWRPGSVITWTSRNGSGPVPRRDWC
ncbi:MAG: hypothetical protein U5R48_07700 [Gammaproteobacteria bacterium]|nr:hypothetical protein [Gammaproteobacteria bacterium]